MEWSLPVNPIILDHSDPLKVASHGFVSNGLQHRPSTKEVSYIGNIQQRPLVLFFKYLIYSNVTKELFL